jgi:uncharacterized protein
VRRGLLPVPGQAGLSERRIGIISDTHGLLRPEALDALAGVSKIIHAGDVGSPDIIPALSRIAPVTVVGGNVDPPGAYPETATVDLGGLVAGVAHGHQASPGKRVSWLRKTFPRAGLIVFGHTHVPEVLDQNGWTLLNPGSAGPQRFRASPTLVILAIGPAGARPQLVELSPEVR